jgi:hypothetical protein
MYRRLTIDGTVVDLPQSGLTYSLVYEVDEEGFVSGAYSKRGIELPSTGVNDALFDDWYAAGSNNELTAATLKPFVFEDGGVQILSGQASLQSGVLMSDRYRFKGRSYKVELYGTNADWTIRMKDIRIRDLDFTSIVYDMAAVMAGWTATYDAGDYSGFTLIKWKEWNTAGQVGIDEFTPFLFIRSILEKAFDTIGYSISSQFLNSDVFKRLILPLPMPARYPEEFSQDYMNVAVKETIVDPNGNYFPVVFTTQTVFPIVGANPYNSSGFYAGFYVAPFTGYYLVQFAIEVVSTAGVWQAEGGIVQDGNFSVIIGSTYFFLPFGSSGNANIAITSQVIYLIAGQFIGLKLSAASTDPSTVFNINMNIIGEAEYAFGSILAFKYLVKDWKVVDMIKGLQQMFNLRFEANPQSQQVVIEPADPYLYRQDNAPTTIPLELRDGFYAVPTVDSTQGLDLEIGARDLQQCADAVMRLRADFLYQQKKYEQIQFQFTNGFVAQYEFWRKGQGILVTGNQCSWVPSARAGSSQQHYKNYLETVFSYAGSLSLSHQLKSVPITQILPGDVLIIGGSPGHAVTVMDIAVQKNTGKKYMLLAQSYMPAQQIHVLKNWEDERISPWFEVPESGKIETPEYTFQTNNLMRF